MAEPRAQRTLVKSPPELWTEVSDPEALARHLEELGAVRITRLDPETTVAWEGDRVRGTVELEASGWGTRVTLTAVPETVSAAPVVEEVAEPVAAPARATAPLPRGAGGATRRPGLLSLFRRRPRAGAALPPQSLRTSATGSDPVTNHTQPRTSVDPRGIPAPGRDGPCAGSDPQVEVRRGAEVEAVLVGVLDELGSASRRPFSR